ncbi:PQ-loop-domain-containing protein [Aspergillus avenaceus]|uniref:PQ-loop-domain-containing protein n=1 Tax=Aspergillus avenaceus TaxID=36643 RepID=A0A5N6TPE6_ASPAV|nr:PQ-loop-domain-containing protein [Aspergillus avenaceus]
MTMADPVSLTHREAASGLLGSISLTCWIFVLVPQLIENYRNGNAEAISFTFLLVWFVGDVANLIGGLWAGLVPVIVAIAVYFCLADGVLISQCLYYQVRNSRIAARRRHSSVEAPDPTTPLLGRPSAPDAEIPHRRSRSSQHNGDDTLAKLVDDQEAGPSSWVKNVSSVLAICVIGMGGWTIAWQSGVWTPAPASDDGETQMAVGAQVVGYFSAVCYLGARLPQIYKNWKDKSCEGLSLLFFILSLLGNLTYGAGILCHSTERNYVVNNIPWLLGSLGTMVEDIAIFIQFRLYATRDSAIVS